MATGAGEAELSMPVDENFHAECTVNSTYMTAIFAELNDQRQNTEGTLCDVVLLAEGKRFPAHKCVLVATSDYFRTMFSVDRFSESRCKEIKLHSVSADALHIILDMIYTFKLKLDLDNVHDLLAAADHLILNEVKKFCCTFLTHVIKSEDPRARKQALRIRKSAEMYNLKELRFLAEKVIGTQFETIVSGVDFKEMELKEVYELLASDQLQHNDEYVIWDAAIIWLEHDLVGRESEAETLMEIIRFPLIDPKFLVQKVKPHYLMTGEKCQEYIQEALYYQVLPAERCVNQTMRSKPRCSDETTLIYCLAGINQFLVFIPHKDCWFSLQAPFTTGTGINDFSETSEAGSSSTESLTEAGVPAKKTRKSKRTVSVHKITKEELFYGILAVAGKVFVRVNSRAQEEVGNYVLRRLKMYSIATNTWKECKLPENTQYVLLIECDGILFNCSRKGIESYDPEKNEWILNISVALNPCQFAVSDQKRIYLYNLENGGIEIVHTDKNFVVTKNQIMWFGRFDILSLSKLDSHDVFLSLRTSSGISREIVNVRTNHWQDVNKRIYPGMSAVQPKPGVSYPHCLNQDDPWEMVYDRKNGETYVLAKWSSITDCPTAKITPKKQPPRTHSDAVLPFFKIDETRTWRRQASLSESLLSLGGNGGPGGQILQLCISDGHTSMATKIP